MHDPHDYTIAVPADWLVAAFVVLAAVLVLLGWRLQELSDRTQLLEKQEHRAPILVVSTCEGDSPAIALDRSDVLR